MMYCFIQERWKKIEHCTSHERTVTSFLPIFLLKEERTWIEGWRKKKWISRRREEGRREEKKSCSSAFFSVELNNDRNVRKEILFLPQRRMEQRGSRERHKSCSLAFYELIMSEMSSLCNNILRVKKYMIHHGTRMEEGKKLLNCK